MRFINRIEEIGRLEKEYHRAGAAFVVLFGRRRLGKTRLLREFFRSKTGLFYVATEATRHIQLSRFRTQLAHRLKDDFLAKAEINDWEPLLEYLAGRIPTLGFGQEKFVLVIDEFQYLVKASPDLPSILQQLWDHKLQDAPFMLILCGSAVSMMHEHVLNASSPLYGRRTAQIRLRPIEFADYSSFVERPIKERLMLYCITGGVPKYIELLGNMSCEELIRDTILDTNGYLYEEPRFLLADEIRQFINYYSILQAISQGCRKGADIAAFVGLPLKALGPYLEILESMHLIERRVPLTEAMPHKSRKGLYNMADPYTAFWFRYLPRYTSELEQGNKDQVLELIMHDFPNHIGPFFERICRQAATLPAFRHNIGLDLLDNRSVGSWWDRHDEIDLVSYARESRTLLLGECKLGQAGHRELAGLQSKARKIIAHYRPQRIVYALFAERIVGLESAKDILTIDLDALEEIIASR